MKIDVATRLHNLSAQQNPNRKCMKTKNAKKENFETKEGRKEGEGDQNCKPSPLPRRAPSSIKMQPLLSAGNWINTRYLKGQSTFCQYYYHGTPILMYMDICLVDKL